VGAFIAGFKSVATKRINAALGTPRAPIWQRNYYEHIIRDEPSLDRIREYILTNPLRWELDREDPAAAARDPEPVLRD
jgi:REP element-mobilizing transposase RayT